jgi:PAS domain S-box-containing protein
MSLLLVGLLQVPLGDLQRHQLELTATAHLGTQPMAARALVQRVLGRELQAARRAEADEGELTFKRADGTSFPAEISSALYYDRPGQMRSSMSIRDIAERRKAERALRESEERFSRVFRSSPVGISITSLDEGRLVDINDSCLHILGYDREDAMGRTVMELGIWKQTHERAEVVQRLLDQGFHRNWGTQFIHKSGEVRDALISMELIELHGQRCILTLVYDITDWKRIEQEREQLIVQLQEALANIKTLRGLVPICASCKKIRDDQGYRNHLESYLQAHTHADFSHGICPDCVQRLYPELDL